MIKYTKINVTINGKLEDTQYFYPDLDNQADIIQDYVESYKQYATEVGKTIKVQEIFVGREWIFNGAHVEKECKHEILFVHCAFCNEPVRRDAGIVKTTERQRKDNERYNRKVANPRNSGEAWIQTEDNIILSTMSWEVVKVARLLERSMRAVIARRNILRINSPRERKG